MEGSVRERLNACLASASPAEKRLASYLLARLANVPFETAASLATTVDVSEPTVGRFCRSLGYANFKDLKHHLKRDLGDRPWLLGDRMSEFRRHAEDTEGHLARSLELEIEALMAVYEIARTEPWRRVVRRLASVGSVHAVGFQTERGIAEVFVHQLQYLRGGVRLLDLAGGSFAELLAANSDDTALVIFEARRYSRMAQLLAADARAAGVPVTLVTDAFCDWGHGLVDELFVVPTEFGFFWESTAQMASLANLLVNEVFIELGPDVERRMDEVTRLYGRYTGHVGDPEGPASGGDDP